MEINFKLIPYQNNPEYIFTLNFDQEEITFKDIIKEFLSKGFLIRHYKEVKFVSNGKQFNDMSDIVNSNHTNFFLFTNNMSAKQNLIDTLFSDIKKDNINIEPLESNEIDSDVDFTDINVEIKEQITPELLDILRICIKKPDLLKQVNSYLQSGNIENPIEINQINEEEYKYNDEFQYISDNFSEYNWDDNIIKNVLMYYSGHINLALRYLINISIHNDE